MTRLQTAVVGVILVASLVFVPDTNAQTSLDLEPPSWTHQLVLQVGPQYPTHDFGEAFATGFAIKASYFYRPSERVLFGLHTGYSEYRETIGNNDKEIVPLNVTTRYALLRAPLHVYAGAEGGLFFVQNKITENTTDPGIAAQLGVRVPLRRGLDLDAGVEYALISGRYVRPSSLGASVGLALAIDDVTPRGSTNRTE